MLTAVRTGSDEENTEITEDQLAVTTAFPDNSQQEEEKDTSETFEATKALSSCDDTRAAPQPEHITVEEQFPTGVTAPEAHTESEVYEGKTAAWLSVQRYTAESAMVDAFPGETTQKESAVEIVLPVRAQVTDYAEEVTSVSGEGPTSSSEAEEETEEQTVLSETSASETAEVRETDKEACDNGAWATHSGVPCESSEPGEAASSESS